MLEMLLDPMGGIVLTHNGHAIQREIEVAHTAAKSLIELRCKYGTNMIVFPTLLTATIASSSWVLGGIESYIGTKFAFRWWKLMFDLALSAVRTVVRDQVGRKEVNIKHHTRVEKIPGGEIEDSRVLDGVMPNKDITHPTMRRRIENLRIIWLDCVLEYKGAGSQTNIEIRKTGWDYVAISVVKPDLVSTEKGVSDLAQHYLLKGNVTALRRARKTNNNRVTRAVGATFVNRVGDINESDVGTKCGLCEIEKISDEHDILPCET
ncbi:GroEL apical domain-like protein [Tuber magnatum]|uniref:GroEL apical domain-like protein n=1 Tax=Tuber magnatum TaxID=42249 RepID=A0A317SPH0_9PEZI|nr:GroEL apical domain-like protein [Tuber magnatum]